MYYKARLVATGFEDSNLIDMRKNSPTWRTENFGLLLAIAVTNKWKVHSLDIKSAFLWGKNIDHEMHLKPTSVTGMKSLWKLNISLYGLCDPPRAWYLSLKSVLEKAGTKKSKHDDALFYFYDNDNLKGILYAHVDDFCRGGSERLEAEITKLIKKSFHISLEGYLGLNVQQASGYVKTYQSSYINELKEVKVSQEK